MECSMQKYWYLEKPKQEQSPYYYHFRMLKNGFKNHSLGGNSDSWLFVALNKNNYGHKISVDKILRHYKVQYRDRYFPNHLKEENVSEVDKAFIRNLLTKPFTLYVLQHSALTMKSRIRKNMFRGIMRDGL